MEELRKNLNANISEDIGRYDYEIVDSKSIKKKPFSEILEIIYKYDYEVLCLNKIITKKDETIRSVQKSAFELNKVQKEMQELKEENRNLKKNYQKALEDLSFQKHQKVSLINELKFLNDRLIDKQNAINQLQEQLNAQEKQQES